MPVDMSTFRKHCFKTHHNTVNRALMEAMPRIAHGIFALIVGLALLTWSASESVQTTTREWFERDVSSRAQLALVGVGPSLANAWEWAPKDLGKQLTDIARNEHVIGVAACDADLKPRFKTPFFPDEFRCPAVGSRIRLRGMTTGESPQIQE